MTQKQDFKRLEADTLVKNKAMRRILDKVGFKLEGIRFRRFRRDDEYISRVAKTVAEARQLIEAGFEFVTEMEGVKIFKKRK